MSDSNKRVLCIPQSSSNTEASPADCLVSYLGHLLWRGRSSPPPAEIQEVYSVALADCAIQLFSHKNILRATEKNSSYIFNCHMCIGSKLTQVVTVAPPSLCLIIYFQIQSVTLMAWTSCLLSKCLKIGESVIVTQKISCWFQLTSKWCSIGYSMWKIQAIIWKISF